MKERIPVPVYAVTVLLVFYTILISLNTPVQITGLLFFISPFLFTWMVVSVLKSTDNNEKYLLEGEDWGYADKKKEELNTF